MSPTKVIRVCDLMTSPAISIGPEASLADVRDLMSERKIRHVPVVDEAQSIIGLVSQRDVLRHAISPADRDNPKVSHLCQPMAPAVLRTLSNVICACQQANTPVTLCGEMAGQPRTFVLLVGMGLRSFSMSPALIPTIKELATHLSATTARQILKRAMTLRTTGRIKRYMTEQMSSIAPNLRLMDTV